MLTVVVPESVNELTVIGVLKLTVAVVKVTVSNELTGPSN